jgi:hypothetical protein
LEAAKFLLAAIPGKSKGGQGNFIDSGAFFPDYDFIMPGRQQPIRKLKTSAYLEKKMQITSPLRVVGPVPETGIFPG